MTRYIIAVDQSTTATKAIVFSDKGKLIGRSDVPHKQIYPKSGWVEHDASEIYANTMIAIRSVVEEFGIDKNHVEALAITNQRETTVLWDGDGNPIYNAVVWQCSRGASIISQKQIAENKDLIRNSTGIFLSPYFSSAKAKWVYDYADKPDNIMFGTMDSWLVYKLTANHATDYSNASRTQLFNIHENKWDRRVIEIFGLDKLRFPKVLSSNDIFGYTDVEGFFERKIPVTGVMGDSHGALFGQKCFSKGMGKATFGTGTSIMLNIGDAPVLSSNGLATSIAWGIDGNIEYVLEGNINSSGDTIKWLVEGLGILKSSKQTQEIAAQVDSTNGVYLVPAFYGLGAPHWDYDCKAIICGISRDITKNHIVRAGVESIAYQIKDIFEAIKKDIGSNMKTLKVDGGATNDQILMQFVADILRIDIEKTNVQEFSALGAAYAAGLAVGFWKDKNELEQMQDVSQVYQPKMRQEDVKILYSGWQKALKRTMAKF